MKKEEERWVLKMITNMTNGKGWNCIDCLDDSSESESS